MISAVNLETRTRWDWTPRSLSDLKTEADRMGKTLCSETWYESRADIGCLNTVQFDLQQTYICRDVS